MKRIKKYTRRYGHSWLLVGIMLLALGVRAWQIEDTLYFRMDQARDAQLIQAAFEGGVGELPLLGPRAAGSFLRLGPIFYYFQFTAAKLFGSVEPYVLAFPDLLFSILAIPLFYYFLTNFFSRKVSLAVTAVFASSFILTQYARFAWNPNSIPFWALLTLLGAYKAVVEKSSQKAGRWLLVAAFGYAVAGQLHFTAFLALPLVIAIFWLFNWPRKIKLKFWALALGILTFFYLPMAISELFTDFDNSHQFLYALTTKGADPVTLATQLEQSLRLHAKYYSMMLTSYGNLKANQFIWAFLAMVVFSCWRFTKIWKKEKWHSKKAFILLIASWFLVFAALYSKLAMDISKPRFWLLVAFLPYIFLGLLLQWFAGFKYKKISRILIASTVLFLLVVNGYAVGYWYYALDKQTVGAGSYVRDLQLKQSDLIGIKQMRTVAADWVEIGEKNKRPICYRAEKSYLSPYEYILEVYYPQAEAKRVKFASDTNQSCSFVSVRHGDPAGKNPIRKDHAAEFKVVSKKLYNRMVVWELLQKPEVLAQQAKQQQMAQSEPSKQETLQQETVEKENEQQPKKLPRKPRVFWKHVFGWEQYQG